MFIPFHVIVHVNPSKTAVMEVFKILSEMFLFLHVLFLEMLFTALVLGSFVLFSL